MRNKDVRSWKIIWKFIKTEAATSTQLLQFYNKIQTHLGQMNCALRLWPRLVFQVPVNPQTSFRDKTSTLPIHACRSPSRAWAAREKGKRGRKHWEAWLNSSFFLNGRHCKHGSIDAHSCAMCGHVYNVCVLTAQLFVSCFMEALRAQ